MPSPTRASEASRPDSRAPGEAIESGAGGPPRDLRKRTAAGLYFVALGLIGCGIAIGVTGFFQMADSVRGLQRSAMPGKTEVTLAAGRTTIYIEGPSENLQCRMTDAQGKPLELRAATAKVTYSFGEYSGRNAWDLDIMAPATYTIECTGKGTIAVGGGIGAWIIVAIVGGALPGLGGLALGLVVFLKRRRQIRAGL